MRILAVASEMHPLVKTGGLADVVGALPSALAPLGVQVTTLLPAYQGLLQRLDPGARTVKRYPALFGADARLVAGRITHASGTDRVLLLDAPAFYHREGSPYGDLSGQAWGDNWRRFAALSAVGADVASGNAGRRPDAVHAHDWQAAMTIPYMRHGAAAHVPAVLTLHNVAFQGQFPAAIFPELGLPPQAFSVDGVEYYGGVGFLKAGIVAADRVTTVSPNYAREIRHAPNGMGLEGLLAGRGDSLTGIVNGIDTTEWNPATDPLLPAHYDAGHLARRAANRAALDEKFGLAPGGTLFIVVSRLTWQKGMDLLADAVAHIISVGGRLAVLGSGDAGLERLLTQAAADHPGQVGTIIGYDEGLSHLMQSGGDAILVPSRFEPCGLTQLYGLRYGCVPVVARTGGLADTVIDANTAAISAGVATGFTFDPGLGDSFKEAIGKARSAHADASLWTALQRQGMNADFSWNASARRYAALFRELAKARMTA